MRVASLIVVGLLFASGLFGQTVVFDSSRTTSEWYEGTTTHNPIERGLKLSVAPGESVTVSITWDPGSVLWIAPLLLTFDDTTWDQFQTVNIRSLSVDSHTDVIITYNASWSDWTHSETVTVLKPFDVNVSASLTQIQTGESIVVNVNGRHDPGESVTLEVRAGIPSVLEVSPSELTFDSSNYNSNQQVIAKGIGGGGRVSQVHVIRPNGQARGVTITVWNLRVTASATQVREGQSTFIGVQGDGSPGRSVKVGVRSDATDRVSIAPSELTINSSNYQTVQEVTVTGKSSHGAATVEFYRKSDGVAMGSHTVEVVSSPSEDPPDDEDDGEEDDDPPDDDGEEDDGTVTKSSCERHVTPYWHGTGGFVVKPVNGRSATIIVHCDIVANSPVELYADSDGLIVQLLSDGCGTREKPWRGTITFEGIEDGGWYWVKGELNAAVAPLLCREDLGGPVAIVPGGVTEKVMTNGTFFKHDTAKLIGIVPHLKVDEEQ